MTLRPFGNVVPIQLNVLALAGYGTDYRSRSVSIPEDEVQRKQNMRRGRRALRRATGQDFGYDLASWHNYLAASSEHGYTHAYAHAGVARAVARAVRDPVRERLAQELAEEEAG